MGLLVGFLLKRNHQAGKPCDKHERPQTRIQGGKRQGTPAKRNEIGRESLDSYVAIGRRRKECNEQRIEEF